MARVWALKASDVDPSDEVRRESTALRKECQKLNIFVIQNFERLLRFVDVESEQHIRRFRRRPDAIRVSDALLLGVFASTCLNSFLKRLLNWSFAATRSCFKPSARDRLA
jgi:hypothetical protein